MPIFNSIYAISGNGDFITKIDIPKSKGVGELFPLVDLTINCFGTVVFPAWRAKDCSAEIQ